jgi:hypothetical protein
MHLILRALKCVKSLVTSSKINLQLSRTVSVNSLYFYEYEIFRSETFLASHFSRPNRGLEIFLVISV